MKHGRNRLKIACPNCRQKLDCSALDPFTRIDCPRCGTEIIVPLSFGDLMLEEPLKERGVLGVYRALDLNLDREVAVKVLRGAGAESEALRSLFLERSRIAAVVNHPHVVPIYSCGEVGGEPYVVMQFMSDGTLSARIRPGGAMDIHWSTGVMIHAALGLQAAQRQGVLHGDIKPGNILFDADGQVKVADFGLGIPALLGDAVAEVAEALPPSPYRSPEAHGEGPGDVRADLYSLGATFYHLLTGHAPDPELASVGAPQVAPCDHSDRIPRPLSDYIMCLLDPLPDKRPADYTALLDTLRGLGRAVPGRRARVAVAAASRPAMPAAAGAGAALARRATASRLAAIVKVDRWRWLNRSLATAVLVLLVLVLWWVLRRFPEGPAPGTEREAAAAGEQSAAPATPGEAGETRPAGGAESASAVTPGAAPLQGRATGSGESRPTGGGSNTAKAARARPVASSEQALTAVRRRRPQPPGLDFMGAKEQLKQYLESLPDRERSLERERLGFIEDSRGYLVQLMRYMPFVPGAGEGGIRLRDGSTIVGQVPYCNEHEMAVRREGGGNTLQRLSWNELAFEQYVAFFEFYIRTRITQGGRGAEGRLTGEQRRDVGEDCFRLALLCDWYGAEDARGRNARRALEYAPERRADLARLLPGVLN